MENFNIHPTAKIGKGCEILAESVNIGPNVVIGENFKFNGQSLTIGKMSRIDKNFKAECRRLTIGENLYCMNDVEIGRGGNRSEFSTVDIGDNVGIFDHVVINPNSPVKIGDNCGIGSEVMIWTHGAWLNVLEGFPDDFGPVTIGKNVWLPARCIVLPNVEIGDNCVIGINSLINKSIPEGSLAAGQPCKVIRENIYPHDVDVTEKMKNILTSWQNHIKFKGRDRFTMSYNNGVITLIEGENFTWLNVIDKTCSDETSPLTEDLRDFLRRHGIKIYTDRPFKSIELPYKQDKYEVS